VTTLTAYDAIRDWLEASWSFTPRRYENEDPLPPSGEPATFLYFECEGGMFAQMSIGAGSPAANLWRENGTAIFTICTPSGTGAETGRGLRQTLAGMLKGLALSPGLQCLAMRGLAGEPFRRDGNYYALPLLTEWRRDEPG